MPDEILEDAAVLPRHNRLDDTGFASRRAVIAAGAVTGVISAAGSLWALMRPPHHVQDPAPDQPVTGVGRSRSATSTPSPQSTPPAPEDLAPPVNTDQSAVRASRAGGAVVASVPVGQQMTGYQAAASAAKPVASSVFVDPEAGDHLLRRTTLGVHPDDRAELQRLGIDGWVSAQLQPETIADPTADAAWATYPMAGATAAQMEAAGVPGWEAEVQTSRATVLRMLFSRRQVFENVVDMMSSHLHIQSPGDQGLVVGDFIMNVLRKYAFGRYSDMLSAAMRHPAMLLYLSNHSSTKTHVNENLGRELLELHTVGVNAGYTEADVLASAKLLTGRTINWDTRDFRYDAGRHWVGPLQVMEFTTENASAADGMATSDSYINYLAHHPQTAQMIARRVAVRFVSDDPSDDLVNRLAQVYLDSDTSLLEVVSAVLKSTDFWSAVGLKTRRPLEDLIGAARALGVAPGTDLHAAGDGLHWKLALANQTPYGWGPPNGYPDVSVAWLSAGAMIQRWNLHRYLINGAKGLSVPDPASLVPAGVSDARGWVAALNVALTMQSPTDAHLQALLSAVGLTGSEPAASASKFSKELAALVLDSPYLQLR